jgi:hypothetical protein
MEVERDRGMFVIATRSSSGKALAPKWMLDSGATVGAIFDSLPWVSSLDISRDSRRMRVLCYCGWQWAVCGILRHLRLADLVLDSVPVRLVDLESHCEPFPEHAILPTILFDSVYFNSRENFVILNPERMKKQKAEPIAR